MKISCQSCAAKYTIADEKVVGKVIKIKCKKCSSTIVVNGNDPSVLAQLSAESGGAYGGEDQATQLATRPPQEQGSANPDEWTVSVTDDDQRTMTTAQILADYGSGLLTADTYVWKDGMGDWLPLAQVPELVPLLAATGQTGGGYEPAGTPTPFAAAPFGGQAADAPFGGQAAAAPFGGQAAAAPFGGQAAAAPFGGQAAAASSAASTAAANAAKRANRASVDLFGGGLQEDVARPAAPMPPGLGDKHVGERNETSVLFSLKDLTAAENAAKNTSARAGAFDKSERVDDIMSLGSVNAAPMLAPPPMNAPVIEAPPPPPPVSTAPVAAMPMMAYQQAPQKKSPVPIILAAVGVVALLDAVGLFVMSGKDSGDKDAKTTSAPADTKPAETAKAKETTTTPADTAKGPPTSEPVATATNTSTSTSAEPTASADPKATATATNTSTTTAAKPDTTATSTKPDNPEPPPADTGKPAAGGDTPFDRGAASSALNGAAGSAKGCKKPDGPTGSAKVQVTFAPSGKATQATVGAPFAGTPVGSCIAGAFRGLKVPPFSGAPVTVSKTVNIK